MDSDSDVENLVDNTSISFMKKKKLLDLPLKSSREKQNSSTIPSKRRKTDDYSIDLNTLSDAALIELAKRRSIHDLKQIQDERLLDSISREQMTSNHSSGEKRTNYSSTNHSSGAERTNFDHGYNQVGSSSRITIYNDGDDDKQISKVTFTNMLKLEQLATTRYNKRDPINIRDYLTDSAITFCDIKIGMEYPQFK